MSEAVEHMARGGAGLARGFGKRMLPGCALAVFFAALIFWANQDMARWSRLGVFPVMQQPFTDMAALLAGGEAVASGVDPFVTPNPFDVYGRPHVYGPGWLASGALGLRATDAGWAGWLTVLVFLAGAVSLFSLRRARDVAIAAAFLATPSVMLGLNRANNDLWIFVIALAAAWLAGRQEKLSVPAALVLVVAAALLKFYPAVMLIAVATLPGRLSTAALRLGLAVLALGLAVLVQLNLYLAALYVMPSSQTMHAFDARYAATFAWVVFKYYDWELWWGVLAGIVVGVGCIWAGRKDWSDFVPTRGRWAFLLVAVLAIWTGCLAAGPSYTYRAIWLLPLVAWAARPGGDAERGRAVFVALVLVMLWLGQPKAIYSLRFDGGDASVFGPMLNYTGAEQMLSLAVWLIGMWMLGGWALRRFREERTCA